MIIAGGLENVVTRQGMLAATRSWGDEKGTLPWSPQRERGPAAASFLPSDFDFGLLVAWPVREYVSVAASHQVCGKSLQRPQESERTVAAGSWQCPHSRSLDTGTRRTPPDQSLAHVSGSMGEAGRYTVIPPPCGVSWGRPRLRKHRGELGLV